MVMVLQVNILWMRLWGKNRGREKEINIQEQKKLMLDMLEYVDDICRKNNIKYSLVGGSLIGAVRHHGYIPWDDDVDIILTEENYKKLVEILDKETGRYQTFRYGKECEKMGFRKLVDTRTCASEDGFVFDSTYGVYIDIFSYCSLSNDAKKRRRQFNKIKLLFKFVVLYRKDVRSKKRRFLVVGGKIASRMIGCKRISRMYESMRRKNDTVKSDYVTCFFPVYSFEKEVQQKKNTEDYIDVKFENLTVMIFKNYDEILRTTFGDYMKLPPESERIPKHGVKAWWRE